MITKPPLSERLKAFIGNDENLNVIKFAKKYGFTKENVYKWQGGTKPSDAEVLIKLESILNDCEDLENVTNKIKDLRGNDNKVLPNRGEINTLYTIAESNRLLADSNRILSEVNLKLANQVIKVTVDDPLGIPPKMIPRFVSVLKLIATAGAKGWQTEAEALAEINNIFYADLAVKKEEGIAQH